jgi:hypothetical protein
LSVWVVVVIEAAVAITDAIIEGLMVVGVV